MFERFKTHPWLHVTGVMLALGLLYPVLDLTLRALFEEWDSSLAVLRRPATWEEALRTLALGLWMAFLSVGVSLPLAWITECSDLPERRWLRVLLNLPLAVPSYVSAFVVVALLGPSGWLAAPLREWGVELPDVRGWFGVSIALLWVYPYALLPLQAALASVDRSQFEAAQTLGSRPIELVRSLLLPQIRPAMAGAGLLVALYALSDFGAVALLRFPVLSFKIYQRQSSLFARDEALMLGVLLAVIALGFIALSRLLAGRREGGKTKTTQRQGIEIPLARLTIPARVFAWGCVAFFLLTPVAVVSYWLVRGLRNGMEVAPVLDAVQGSFSMGAVAAVATVSVAVIPALLARFGQRSVARLTSAASWAGYALPGIVVALALVWASNRSFRFLYQTYPLLVIAYVLRFLPHASHQLSAALQAQNSRIYEAARTLGLTSQGAWFRAVLPPLRPVFAASLIAVFISVLRELPATLLLSPTGFRSLSTEVWRHTADAYFTAASVPVLLLVALAALSLLVRQALGARQTRRTPASSTIR